MNTLTKGQFRWIIFKEGKWWVGAALEFNIVIVGKDPRVVEVDLHEAVAGYLEDARSFKGVRSAHINATLNQRADSEYEKLWETAKETMRGNIPSPLSRDIYKFGMANLATAA
jgi:predicted RNase H-like HicB family nuclease